MATVDDDNDREADGEKVRSRRYPQISLKNAVGKIKAIYDADKTAGSPMLSALKHMGYKSRSGPASSVLAALKRFGLIESRGGRVHLTQRAVAICVLGFSDTRRSVALKEAALEPASYRELYEQYKDTGLPSKESLEQELMLSGQFNHNAVSGFVNDFLETLEFAGLTANGMILSEEISPDGDGDEDDEEDDDEGEKPVSKAIKNKKRRMIAKHSKQDVYSLGGEGDLILEYPLRLTAESVKEIEDWFALVIRKMNRIVATPQSSAADEDDQD